MNEDFWLSVISRITPSEPAMLDDVLGVASGEHDTPGWANGLEPPHAPLSAKLWERDATRSHIGVRVMQPPADLVGSARRLAAIALERSVIPILISPLAMTGFERFGFRVERLPDADKDVQTVFEEDLCGLWNMAIVIDLADVESLG